MPPAERSAGFHNVPGDVVELRRCYVESWSRLVGVSPLADVIQSRPYGPLARALNSESLYTSYSTVTDHLQNMFQMPLTKIRAHTRGL